LGGRGVRAPRPPADAGAAWPLPGERTYTALTPATVVPLAAERLRTEKRTTDLGEVRVEERELPDRPATGTALFAEGTIVVPLRGEEAVVRKEAVITGEVLIGKELVTERRDVTATVRAEHAEVIEQAFVRHPPAEAPAGRAAQRGMWSTGPGKIASGSASRSSFAARRRGQAGEGVALAHGVVGAGPGRAGIAAAREQHAQRGSRQRPARRLQQ